MGIPATTVSTTVLPQREKTNHPYSHSIASSASSSSDSIFSNDEHSSQSSAPSSVKSANVGWEEINRTVGDGLATTTTTAGAPQQNRCPCASPTRPTLLSRPTAIRTRKPENKPNVTAVAPELRVHPRRTQPQVQGDFQQGKTNVPVPPPLIRQCDRKDNFVEGLVDTTTQMIETVWPLSVPYVRANTDSVNKNLIDLRTFIQEVLKRSKTSYSTLQVALYYLVLIKSRVPSIDFTQIQLEDSHASRAMQCGRRMFLAALILASKYLQDRNYSARAWSKISGLKVCEINANELAFLNAVDWKIHIPEARFQRWTDIVFTFSLKPAATAAFLGRRAPDDWRNLVPRLTPALEDSELGSRRALWAPTAEDFTSQLKPMSPPKVVSPALAGTKSCAEGRSPRSKLETVEPTPTEPKEGFRFPPISPRITQLPTPQLTPRTNAFYPPAVSAVGHYPGKSMQMAMREAERLSINRCTLDTLPTALLVPDTPVRSRLQRPRLPSRCPSVASSISSPDSTISDAFSHATRSSYSSRASSVCSRQVSAGALSQPQEVASLATPRTALQTPTATTSVSDNHRALLGECLSASPGTFTGMAPESFIRGVQRRRDDPEATAAMALRELASASNSNNLPVPRFIPATQAHRKRERPLSITDYAGLGVTITRLNPNSTPSARGEAAVLEDANVANSFLLRENVCFPLATKTEEPRQGSYHSRSESGSRHHGGARKRCCKDEAWSQANASSVFAHSPSQWAPVR